MASNEVNFSSHFSVVRLKLLGPTTSKWLVVNQQLDNRTQLDTSKMAIINDWKLFISSCFTL